MKNTIWTLTFVSLLGSLGPVAAMASYQDEITERTSRNQGVSGKWFSLKTDDWVFFDSEASAANNMGAIKAGEKVEVLKWNKHMARVRLPDGRVVFIRNRLLQEATAPSSAEKATRAKVTIEIGRTQLAKADPYSKPATNDFATLTAPGRRDEDRTKPDTVIASRDDAKKPNALEQTLQSATAAFDAAVARSKAETAKTTSEDKPKTAVDAISALLNDAGTESGSRVRNAFVPEDDKTTVTPVKADETILTETTPAMSEDQPERVQLPSRQEIKDAYEAGLKQDGLSATTETQTVGKCDPKREWQPPVHQKYRIRDCVGSDRPGPRVHAGADIAGEQSGMEGMPIYSVASGTVILARVRQGYGCSVTIEHDNCPTETGRIGKRQKCVTRYAHLGVNSKGRCDVPQEGTRVNSCTRIGKMSGTGGTKSGRLIRTAYPVHLHFEMRDESETIVFNPMTALASLTTSQNLIKSNSTSCRAVNTLLATRSSSLARGNTQPVATVEEARD